MKQSTRRNNGRNKKDKKDPAQRLTPELLERRVKQLMAATQPERPVAFVQTKGTLEQIGHEADQAWTGVKKIMSLLNVEMKHSYYNSANNTVTQAGAVLDVTSLISQGVGGAQRIGDSLKAKRFRGKFTYGYNPTQTAPGTATFVLGMSRDGVPAVADVFAAVSTSTSGQAFPIDTYDKVDFWKVAKTINVNPYEPQRFFELNHDFNHDVLYTNASTTSTSGTVWLAYISSEPTNYPTLQIAWDFEFLDN